MTESAIAPSAGDLKRRIGLRLTVLARVLRNRFDREVTTAARGQHTLTKAAEPLLAKRAEIARDGKQHGFRGFSHDELDALQGYLDRIYKNVD